jgi:hypothetical protein
MKNKNSLNEFYEVDEVEFLIEFLQERVIYEKFKKNYVETEEVIFVNAIDFITSSFDFKNTEEGEEFWNKINEEWKIELDKFRKEFIEKQQQ